MAKKRVFVSFDYDNDKALKEFVIGQTKLPESPFSAVDVSLKEEQKESEWEAEAERRIKSSDIVLVMVGEKTHSAPGVKKEVAMAGKHSIKIAQIIGRKDTNPTAVPNAGTLYKWSWDNLKLILK